MGSALPKLDVSVHWPVHSCGFKHEPGAWCPKPGVWLIAGTPTKVQPLN